MVFMFIISKNPIFTEDKKYPDNVCKEIFDGIGISLLLLIKNVKKQKIKKRQNWEKTKNDGNGTFFSQVVANYASSYEIVCR